MKNVYNRTARQPDDIMNLEVQRSSAVNRKLIIVGWMQRVAKHEQCRNSGPDEDGVDIILMIQFQLLPSKQVCSQLVNMSAVPHRTIAMINPNRHKAERDRLRPQMVNQSLEQHQ